MIGGLLDETHAGILNGHVGPALTLLYARLHEIRQRITITAWRKLVEERCLPHPLTALIHQDPLTGGSFRAARERRFDHTLLDYIYYRTPVDVPAVTALGREIFAYTTHAALARAIRTRRAYTASLLDFVVGEQPNARVLALDPGHLREAELASSLVGGGPVEFIALSNATSELTRIAQTYGAVGVRTQTGSPLAVAQGEQRLTELDLGEFDLIYCPTLFNQLADHEAARLMREMWSALKPGGHLLIPNFLTGIVDAGFAECYAGWAIHHRTRTGMVDLVHAIPADEITGLTLDTDRDRAMAYLVLRRQM